MGTPCLCCRNKHTEKSFRVMQTKRIHGDAKKQKKNEHQKQQHQLRTDAQYFS